MRILAVNSGYSLSFLKPAIKEARIVAVENEGSQFRSRDFYPKVLGEIARDDYSRITDREPEIPDMPRNVVCFTDGYGNLKTSINPGELEDLVGTFLSVAINGYKHYVKVGRSIFDVPDGHLCIARGSSGWTYSGNTREEFAEIVCCSGNASKIYKQPKSGTPVTWQPA